MIGALCLALLLTSCRRGSAPPTAHPTMTPTPRSTALPPVPTPIPPGAQSNPLHMEIVTPPTGDQSLDVPITLVETELLDGTGMNVVIDMVHDDAEALAALCDSPTGKVAAAWLGGLAYAGAYAQGCGGAALQVQRGGDSGEQAWIVVNSSLDVTGVGDLADHVFCRLGYTDLFSWLIPSLMLKAGGVSSGSLKEIRDYADAGTMIDDLAAGSCDAAGVARSQFKDIVGVRVLQQSATIPFAVLVVPEELPLGQRQQLTGALLSIADGSRAATLNPLLDQDRLVAVTDGDLSDLRSFVSRAGIDLAQAGS